MEHDSRRAQTCRRARSHWMPPSRPGSPIWPARQDSRSTSSLKLSSGGSRMPMCASNEAFRCSPHALGQGRSRLKKSTASRMAHGHNRSCGWPPRRERPRRTIRTRASASRSGLELVCRWGCRRGLGDVRRHRAWRHSGLRQPARRRMVARSDRPSPADADRDQSRVRLVARRRVASCATGSSVGSHYCPTVSWLDLCNVLIINKFQPVGRRDDIDSVRRFFRPDAPGNRVGQNPACWLAAPSSLS